MASVLSRRLGKRSLLGARISAPPLLGDGMLMTAQVHPLQPEHTRASSHQSILSYEDGHFKEHVEASGNQNQNWPVLQPGQKVYVFYNGQESAGLVEYHDPVSHEVKVLLPEKGFYVTRKDDEVRLAEVMMSPLPKLEMDLGTPTTMDYSPVPVVMEHCTSAADIAVTSALRSVSRSIDVPKRKPDAAVEMDEMMAAMVLTSLSCSPVVQSPPNNEASISTSQATCDAWKESGDMSDGGSSTTSGHWSGISTPSPPHSEASPKYSNEAFSSPRADDGFETDSDPFLFEEPAPRKRKVRSRSLSFSEQPPPPPVLKSQLIVASPPRAPSGTRKVRGEAKKCRKVYGIEHRDQWCTACRRTSEFVRKCVSISVDKGGLAELMIEMIVSAFATKHWKRLLGSYLIYSISPSFIIPCRDGANSDQRKREEDFYYTEMQVKEEALPESLVVAPNPTAGSSPIVIQQAASQPEPLILDQATPLEPHLPSSALSQSAPSSFWHIQADHAYQALPSIQIPVSPHIFTSISWAAATSTIPTLSPVRSRSLSFSEQPPPPPVLKSQLIVASPPRAPSGTRKVRGEAKKCRKVYGIEHRDQWCTACRWKKACQRFLD
ncbi:PREDICTED: zinc finger protein 395 [Thamnophis sirtalis]|uniref:Zinc finger protein 395 n=1 Tax=Thamnophis sirtalis TaxID=35019 RepID=A0A6I9XU97_9SAUR|nr:PREDICTED: zinc finger protein 395 [Thamnophis sirtalis]